MTKYYIIDDECNKEITDASQLLENKIYRCRLPVYSVGIINDTSIILELSVQNLSNIGFTTFEYITDYSEQKLIAYSNIKEIIFTKPLKIISNKYSNVCDRYTFE